MKKFRFKLQTVLKYRRFLEERKKREFAIYLGKLNEAKNTMERLKIKLNETLISINRERTIKELDIVNIMLYESYLIKLKRLIEWKLIEIEQIREKLEEKRKAYIESSRDRKILDRLKEKEYSAYISDLDKKIQSIIDEIAITKYYAENYSMQINKEVKE